MGSFKPQLVAELLRRNTFSAVVLSDTDTSWLRDPMDLIKLHPLADLMVSTDCLSHEAEAKKALDVNRCGHTPGSKYNIALNTGVLLWRNTSSALAILDRWHKVRCAALRGTHTGQGVHAGMAWHGMACPDERRGSPVARRLWPWSWAWKALARKAERVRARRRPPVDLSGAGCCLHVRQTLCLLV